MNRYGILNSAKRALIALIHTVIFGLLALYQLLIRQHPLSLLSAGRGHSAAPIALTTIYFIVTLVLLILLRYSQCSLERLYFTLCATSAAIGLLRALVGDPTAYAELAARVLLLGSAIITGMFIWRAHTQAASEFAD
jgi:hypothetical protein